MCVLKKCEKKKQKNKIVKVGDVKLHKKKLHLYKCRPMAVCSFEFSHVSICATISFCSSCVFACMCLIVHCRGC